VLTVQVMVDTVGGFLLLIGTAYQYAVIPNSTKVTILFRVLVPCNTAYQYAQRNGTPMTN
jgi:hypothetical protein